MSLLWLIDVGVALSDAEASIVAPFTSLDKNVASVIDVLKEGRCALASSFASYKYMLMYGQVETFNQVVNAYFNTTFGEWCWLFLDGLWPITMAFSLPLSRAALKLSKRHPTASILSPHTLASACGVLTINLMFLAVALAILFQQDWFQCRQIDNDDMTGWALGDAYETSTIFVITGYQYISSAAAFNFGYTWRRSWWRNYVFGESSVACNMVLNLNLAQTIFYSTHAISILFCTVDGYAFRCHLDFLFIFLCLSAELCQ